MLPIDIGFIVLKVAGHRYERDPNQTSSVKRDKEVTAASRTSVPDVVFRMRNFEI
jgi:hypothetical protein